LPQRRGVWTRCLLEGVDERSISMATSCCPRRELRCPTSCSGVIASSLRLKRNIVHGARSNSIVVRRIETEALLSRWTIEIKRVLFTLRELLEDGLHQLAWLRSRSSRIGTPGIARHLEARGTTQSSSNQIDTKRIADDQSDSRRFDNTTMYEAEERQSTI
jgi:hypothetical protein